MMKELFNFIKWQWNQWEAWQKVWVFSSVFLGASFGASEPYSYYLAIVPTVVTLSYVIKWVVWDGTKSQWNRYQEHKQKLFDTIKHSETTN